MSFAAIITAVELALLVETTSEYPTCWNLGWCTVYAALLYFLIRPKPEPTDRR